MSLQGNISAKRGGGIKKSVQARGGPKVTKTVKGPKATLKRSPSMYLADMKRTTEEKLAMICEMYPPKIIELLDMGTTSIYKDSSLSIDQALFQPFPSEVFFQQYKPQQVYQFPLQLRNLDKVARHIKVTCEASPYFSITFQRGVGSKVAPGMEISCTVVFTPDENKDYEHELICTTEREKFVVPVKTIGARALLDFPDEVIFTGAPVKYDSSKTILIRNVGNAEAKFTMDTTKPFSVTPSTATLAVNACMQATISYVPKQVGEHSTELVIQYSTREDIYTKIYGNANDINVRLERSSISFDTTFIGLTSQRSVVLHNNSDVVVRYQWKAFSSEEEEDIQREILMEQIKKEEKLSKEAFYQRCMHNPSIRDRLPILTRTLNVNRKKYTDDEHFLYSDDSLSIQPLEGEVWPHSQTEISLIFFPDKPIGVSRVAYCDVIGRESRLPLKIKGEGKGPHCIFSFDTLDIQNVFINSAHAYEVFLENKGHIEANYALVPPTTLFGPNFTFAPSSGTLQPGQLQAIQISFCSRELGEFNEEFQWELKGGTNILTLSIRGIVIGPTFKFDCSQVRFGTISCGFTVSKEVVLSNTSEIPMSFSLCIPGGSIPSDRKSFSSFPNNCKEFAILPEAGTIPPNFQQVVQVNFTPLHINTYSVMMVLDLQDSGRVFFSLPISARSVAPPITVLTSLLNYWPVFP